MPSSSKAPARLARREIPDLPRTGRGLTNLPAWALSLILHTCLIATIGTFWTGRVRGTGGEKDRPVGVAVVYELTGGEAYFLNDSGASDLGASDSSDAGESLSASLPDESVMKSDQQSLLEGLLPSGAGPSGDPSAAAGGLGLGDGGAQIGGNRTIPKVKTTVFGIEGEGTRFLYVFDRSDSMNGYGGLPLSVAKAQLLESIRSLGPTHQFQIIFYNDSPLPFGGLGGRGPALLTGDEQTKLAASRFVRDVSAFGGTRHVDALRMALSMGPDVVFFLTDADYPSPAASELENLHTRAARSGCTIHTIQFGAGPSQGAGGGWIKSLATGTAGRYRYMDVAELAN